MKAKLPYVIFGTYASSARIATAQKKAGVPAFDLVVADEAGTYRMVEGLPVDAFSQQCIDKTLKELLDEQAGVAHLV